jgi:hypothetical protein
MRMDPLGKGMAQMLLDMETEVPPSIGSDALNRDQASSYQQSLASITR